MEGVCGDVRRRKNRGEKRRKTLRTAYREILQAIRRFKPDSPSLIKPRGWYSQQKHYISLHVNEWVEPYRGVAGGGGGC